MEETLSSGNSETGCKLPQVTQPVSDQGENRGQCPESLSRVHRLELADQGVGTPLLSQPLCSPSKDRGGWEGLQSSNPAPDPKSGKEGK